MISILDLGTSKISAALASNENNKLKVLEFCTVKSEGFQNGTIVDLSLASKSIRNCISELESKSQQKIKNLYVSFSDEKIIGNETTGHSTGNEREIVIKDMKQAMKSSTEYLVPENIDLLYPVFKDFVIDGKDGIADPRGMRGVRLQAKTHLIYCSKNMKNNIKQCVEERNNLKIQKYFFSQLGAADCTLSNDQKNLGVCLIDIGAGTTDISVYKSGKIIFSKVFDRGGEYLTDRIAFHLEIPTHKAEEMKLKHGTALENQANNEILKVGNLNDGIQKEISRRDLAKVIETHLSLLFRECLRIVQDGGFDEKIPAGFVFTGGTSNLEGIQDLGREIMQKNVKIGIPEYNIPEISESLLKPQYSSFIGMLNFCVKEENKHFKFNSSEGMIDQIRGWLGLEM